MNKLVFERYDELFKRCHNLNDYRNLFACVFGAMEGSGNEFFFRELKIIVDRLEKK